MTASHQSKKPWVVATWQHVGEFLGGMSKQAASQLIHEGCPRVQISKGKYLYDLSEIAQWYYTHLNAKEAVADEADPENKRIKRLRADLLQIEKDAKLRKLLPRAQVEKAMDYGISAFVTSMANIRDELLNAYPGDAARIGLKFEGAVEQVKAALEEYDRRTEREAEGENDTGLSNLEGPLGEEAEPAAAGSASVPA